jgi:hypothetical protein
LFCHYFLPTRKTGKSTAIIDVALSLAENIVRGATLRNFQCRQVTIPPAGARRIKDLTEQVN